MTDDPRPAGSWEALWEADEATRARWQAIWMEEYKSLRSESEQSRASQQTILQWSLASFAAILAAGLVAFRSNAGLGAGTGQSGTLLLLVFGLGLPGLGFFAYLVWWGEFKRMERAGNYLRGLESVAWLLVGHSDAGRLPPPLQWENFLSGRRGPVGTKGRKILVGYFGTAAIYGGFVSASLLVFYTLVHSHHFNNDPLDARTIRGLCYVGAVLAVVAFALITGILYRSAGAASVDAEAPADTIEYTLDIGENAPFRRRPRTKRRLPG